MGKNKSAKRSSGSSDKELEAIKKKVAEKRAKREKEAAKAAAGVTYEKKAKAPKPAFEVAEPEEAFIPEADLPEDLRTDESIRGHEGEDAASVAETVERERIAKLNMKAAALRETIADKGTKKKARWAAEQDLDKVLGELRDLGAPFAHIAAGTSLETTANVVAETDANGGVIPAEYMPEQTDDYHEAIESFTAIAAGVFVAPVGTPMPTVLNQPSPPVEDEDPVPRDHLKRPLLYVPGTDKPQGHTRVTTFVGAIEDQEGITRWKGQRIVEGFGQVDRDAARLVAAADHAVAAHATAVAHADQILAEDECTLAEYRDAIEMAEATLKKALDEIREEAFVLGGGKKKADAGTRLHKLTEYVDRGEDLPDDVTASELADLDAYKRECDRVGLKHKAIELFVADPIDKTAGTLDRLSLYKPEGAQRAKTVVADIKTGKLDYPGKIAGQVAKYAGSEVVDLDTIRDPDGKRTKLGAVQDIGLVIHLPAGRGECTIYEIDLAFGRRWNKLCGEVRSIRNESKRKGVVLKAVES